MNQDNNLPEKPEEPSKKGSRIDYSQASRLTWEAHLESLKKPRHPSLPPRPEK